MENLGHADAVLEKLLQFADLNYNGEVRLVATVLELWVAPQKIVFFRMQGMVRSYFFWWLSPAITFQKCLIIIWQKVRKSS